jgi:long-chain acyl-CoA synthetase
MRHPWLDEYPEGVPAEVDIGVHASVPDLLTASCRRFAELPACSNLGVSLSYRDLDRLSAQFAAWLQQVARLDKGDRVALMLPNLLQYPVSLFGVLRAGMIAVNVNPLYTPRELEHQLRDSGAVLVVVLENFAHTLEAVIERTQVWTVVTTQVGDLFPGAKGLLTNLAVKYVKRMVPAWRLANATAFPAALRAGRRQAMRPVPLGHGDVAFLQYTGGTTGVAKGAVLTHGNMVANVEQLSAWIARDMVRGQEVVAIPLPLYHVYALIAALVFLEIGAQVLLITNPRDLPRFVQELRRTPVTAIVGVNTLYNALLNMPGFTSAGAGLQRLKLAFAGGMAVQRAVAERWKQATGVPIVEGYGLTEASPVVTSNRLDIGDWTGAAGLPLPSTEIAVVDEAGVEMPAGELGELIVRGPQVMRGYWNRPDETAKVLDGDGWLHTGDMGYLDDKGYFRLTDRKKDVIVVSGFKVFPNEIEDVVAMHPGVLESAAIGVPDRDSGEAVKIIVVRKDPALTEAELLAHCRRNLTGYKVPRHIEFRDQPLPKSNIGKVLRRLLREPVAA